MVANGNETKITNNLGESIRVFNQDEDMHLEVGKKHIT